jgi:hypothetical protein
MLVITCLQVPIPEISRLRTGQSWTVRDQEVLCGDPVLIPGPPRPALDISLILQRCSLPSIHQALPSSVCPHKFNRHIFIHGTAHMVNHLVQRSVNRGEAESVGLLFQSWKAGGEGSAAILFDFDRNILEAVFEVPPLELSALHLPVESCVWHAAMRHSNMAQQCGSLLAVRVGSLGLTWIR